MFPDCRIRLDAESLVLVVPMLQCGMCVYVSLCYSTRGMCVQYTRCEFQHPRCVSLCIRQNARNKCIHIFDILYIYGSVDVYVTHTPTPPSIHRTCVVFQSAPTMLFFDTSAILMTFMLLGKLLEQLARGKASNAVSRAGEWVPAKILRREKRRGGVEDCARWGVTHSHVYVVMAHLGVTLYALP